MSDYIRRSPRAINGQWIEGLIRKGEQEEKEDKAFEFFCSKLRKGSDVEKATKETKKRYEKIPIVSEKIPQSPFQTGKPIIRLTVG